MTHVFAKIKMKASRNKNRKILSTEENFYDDLSQIINSSCEYSPELSLDEAEWFKISDFSAQSFSIEITKESFETVDYALLQKNEYDQLDYLFVKEKDVLFFQKVGKSKFLRKKGIVSIGDNYNYNEDMSVIFINEYPDAIYVPTEDTLYFKRLESITSIFKGISELYREATEREVQSFLENEFITIEGGFTSSDVKTPNRKRIAIAMETLERLEPEDKKRIFTYIGEYCPDLETDEHKFKIASEADLKMVLYGIEQRFYTTSIGDERRIAKSVIRLQNNRIGE